MYRIQHLRGVTTQRHRKEVKIIDTRGGNQLGGNQGGPAATPYALVEVLVGGVPVMARPFEFDSEVADQSTMTNRDGRPVRPVKLSTSCPHCGHGIVVDLDIAPPHPGSIIDVGCQECGTGVQKIPVVRQMPDPFCNPLLLGLLTERDLDPDAAVVTVDLQSLVRFEDQNIPDNHGSPLQMGPELELS